VASLGVMAAAGGPSEEADPSEASSEVLMVLGRVAKDDETDDEIIYVRGGQGNDLPIEGLPKEIDRAASTDITAEESPRGRDSESSGQLEPRSPWMVSDDPGKTTLSKVSLEPQVPEDDDNSPCEDHSKSVRDFHRGVCTYFFACVVVIGSLTAITTMVWSSMGVGEDVLQWTQDNDWLWYPLTFLYLLIFILLYLFDFFLPPHLPGQHLLLWHGDVFVGRGLLLFAVFIFLTSFFFITVDRPEMPLIVMVSLHPTFIILVWFVLVREKSPKGGKEGADDHLLVFTAITAAFWFCCVVGFGVWLAWALTDGQEVNDLLDDGTLSSTEEEELFLLWATPLVVALANFVYGLFASLRVLFHKSYVATFGSLSRPDRPAADELRHLQKLSKFVKILVTSFIVAIGCLYVAAQLLYTQSVLATLAMGIIGVFFLIFVLLILFAFRHVAEHIKEELKHVPIWKLMLSVRHSDWIRAMTASIFLPLVPLVFALSFATQLLRRCRGTYRHVHPVVMEDQLTDVMVAPKGHRGSVFSEPHPQEIAQTAPEKLWFTPFVDKWTSHIFGYNWLSMVPKGWTLCLVFFVYQTFPILLNPVFSWLTDIIGELRLWLIIPLTFWIGMLAFLLPPVPGLTVYVFGGLILSSSEAGFWGGAVINIFLGWFLKLCACAVQQVIIGGMLGKFLWVRQTVGVHKVAVRSIEAELRRPGFTMGKVAILCGGPDWPTSVLAGMLGLSLVQCELGTLPIIFFVIPCALTGSFYLEKGTSEVWSRSANLMVLASVMVSLSLWAISAWAIQVQLDENHEELSRPLAKNVDLEWLDYKMDQTRKRVSLTWARLPTLIQFFYIVGWAIQVLVLHVMYWGYYQLFTSFEVSDDIDDLSGCQIGCDGGLIQPFGVVAVGVYVGAWLCRVPVVCWMWGASREPRRKAELELSVLEAQWKDSFVQRANDWIPPTTATDSTQESNGHHERDSDAEVEEEEEQESLGAARGVTPAPLFVFV